MCGFDNVLVTAWRRALCCLAVTGVLTAGAAPDVSEPAKGKEPGAAQKRHPLVVLKQTEIRGRVFFLPDEGEGPAVASSQLEVAVHERGGGKLVHKTVTGDDGGFVLPDLNVGTYDIRIGGLTLELSVQARAEGDKKPIPKTLLVFMPRELEK